MGRQRFRARTTLHASPAELWSWHLSPGALERLTPPWAAVEVVGRSGALAEGSTVELRVPLGPLRIRWQAEHRDLEAPLQFRDIQTRGPFRSWVHTHRFHPEAEGRTALEDTISYEWRGGALGRLLGGRALRRELRRTFAYRHAVTGHDLARHRRAPAPPPLRVALSGSSGLVGSALAAFLSTGGHEVLPLVRRPMGRPGEILYEPARGRIDEAGLEGVDAVVHLAGENIAGGRWTPRRKRAIRDSRVLSTALIAGAMSRLREPPRVLVNASAIGYYGDREDEPVDEQSPPGTGFLAETCREWEEATEPARRAGLRVVRLRIGIVLAAAGGALRRMLPLFRLGLGGRLGSGRQFMSWIALDDLIGVLHFALADERLSGAVNAVSPGAVRNREFTRSLGRVLRRPAALPAPASALRLALGEMGDELLLAGARVAPRALERCAFEFRHASLESAMRFELGRPDFSGLPTSFEFAG